MKDRLPVHIENRELPKEYQREVDNSSSGYINILFLSSFIITIASVITIIMLRK